MPRHRLYANDAERQKAFRERRAQDVQKKSSQVSLLANIVETAERRGFIVVENAPVEEKAEKLLHFLETVPQSQLCIMDTKA